LRNLGGFFWNIMHKIDFVKPVLDLDAQLQLLQKRGLIINNWDESLKALANISYYRLSAYWLPFKQRDQTGKVTDFFQGSHTFDKVIEFYEFDRKLRLLVLDAIERVEISVRASVTNYLSNQYGSFMHEKSSNFHNKFSHSEWIMQVKRDIVHSKETFVQHYQDKYTNFPVIPIWMIVEIISFGTLSIFYKGLKNEDKRKIADNYQLHPKSLTHWLHFLTYVRNVCAHHSRLWNRELSIRIRLDGLNKLWHPPLTPRSDRSFFILLILKYLLNCSGNGENWSSQCEELILPMLKKYPWIRESMGVTKDWPLHPLW
jgi:abortive infection bacteriophage resistance protein